MDCLETLPFNLRVRPSRMKQRKKKKPDFRRIAPTRTYSVPEFAKAVHRNPATVRKWIREGMPTLDTLKPLVIDGAEAKKWLRHKWDQRKKPTHANEAHCLHCRESRTFADGSKYLRQINGKVLAVSGNCSVCGCRMNKFASAKFVALFDVGNERKRANSAA